MPSGAPLKEEARRNNRIPALVDDEPSDGGPLLSLFESGAILLYLADNTGNSTPTRAPRR
jgi:glutathione S-transferase